MNKFKRFVYENKKEIIAFGVLFVCTLLLCIPFTMNYAVKVFGWAVWFYLALGYAAAVLHCRKKKINLTPKTLTFLILSLFFALATLHVACMDRLLTASFTKYIVGSYQSGTVGGAVFGIITSPVTVLFTYVWAIVFFMLLTTVFSFLFFRPFIFAGTANPFSFSKRKKKIEKAPVCHEVILDEAPFMNKKKTAEKSAPVAYMTEETAFEKEKDPRKLLFGGVKETYSPSITTYSGEGDYDVKPYVFRKKSAPSPDISEEQAVEILLGKDKTYEEENILNYEEESEETVIFDDEKDESIPDLLKPRENPFLQALKQSANERYAPSPIVYGDEEEDEEETDIHRTESTEKENKEYTSSYTDVKEIKEERTEPEKEQPVPPQQPNGAVGVSSDYVYYEGKLIPVMKSGTAVNPQPAQPSAHQPYTGPIVSSAMPNVPIEEEGRVGTYHKIVQLVKRPDLPYNKPPISVLKNHVTENFSPTVDNWDELKEIFEVRLRNFGVEAKLVDAVKGPTVTLCAIELGDRCPIAKLYSLKTDLQRWLKSSKPIAIIPQLPDTDYCGVQIPNEVKSVVGFKEVLTSKEYREAKGDIVIAMGKTAEGEILIEDLAAMPHALVAGETGSGKSVCLNVILSSIIFRYSPEEVKLLLIDLKEVEMAPYAGLPHMLLKEPLSSIPEIVNALKWIREEVVGRFTLFKTMHIRNLTEYNNREGVEKLPRIVIIIDEASELMSDANARKTLESTLNSLARIARAAGIHLIFATQNPVKTVITNEIQNNLNTKIAFAVGDYVHSQVIFKAKGAECLLGRGDMYIKRGQEMRRAQCALITTAEIEEAAAYIRENNEYDFNEEEIEKILNGSAASTTGDEQKSPTPAQSGNGSVRTGGSAVSENNEDEGGANEPDLNWQALKICVDANYVSCSYLQRKLKRGYNTVANILEELAAEGYLSSVPQGSKEKREILISKEDFYREWAARYGADEDAELENFDKSGD